MRPTADGLAGRATTTEYTGTARQAQDRVTEPASSGGLRGGAAAVPPRAAAAPQTSRPEGSPAPLQGAASTSPQQRHGRVAAAGMPGPETGARPPLLGQAPVRARPETPAGAETPREGTAPAGSTGTLFVNIQDTERTALERARRADSKAFLDAHLAGKMTEAELEEQIRDACTTLGILRFHVRFSMGTTAGLPDDILIGPRGILWRECKTAKGKVTAAQQEAGTALTNAGQDWAVWRPVDWFSGRIQRELAGLAGIRGTAA